METTLSDSGQRTKDRRASINSLLRSVRRAITTHLKAEGRGQLRLDEMFSLFKSVIQHVAPDKQAMIWPYQSFDPKK